MRVEALGHACFIVKAGGATLLFDPLLMDPHHEGLYEVYPRRELDVSFLPDIDAIVVSHAHADHLHPDSLGCLPRNTPVIAADDPLLIGCLEGLGFTQIIKAQNLVPIEVGDAILVPTPASEGALEHGFVIQEGETTLWHMVDTFPSPSSVAAVLGKFPSIDILIAPWQPLQDASLAAGAPIMFPFEMYARILSTIAQISPKLLIPGACGFRAVGPASFTNHIIFPVARDKFIRDIAAVVPKLAEATSLLEPGDALMTQSGMTVFETGLLPYCKSAPDGYDWRELAFRPFELGFKISEPRGKAFCRAQCLEAAQTFFEETLPEFIAEQQAYFFWHSKWKVVWQFEVAFHEEDSAFWTLDFSQETPTVSAGQSPLATAHTAMPVSLLIGLVAGTISWDYAQLSAELRSHQHIYLACEDGLRRPEPGQIFEPLLALFGTSEAAEEALSLQVERVHAEWEDTLRTHSEISPPLAGEERKVLDASAVYAEVLEQFGAQRPVLASSTEET